MRTLTILVFAFLTLPAMWLQAAEPKVRSYLDPGYRKMGVYAGGPKRYFDYSLAKMSLADKFPKKKEWWAQYKNKKPDHTVWTVFAGMRNGKDLETIFLQYWKKIDPTPGTNINELMEEYYIRVNYVNEYFNMSWKEGWETDFGMIYILFGPPDEIQRSNVNSSNTSTYQIWYYNRISKQFIFKDQNGFGDYRLDRPFIGSTY